MVLQIHLEMMAGLSYLIALLSLNEMNNRRLPLHSMECSVINLVPVGTAGLYEGSLVWVGF